MDMPPLPTTTVLRWRAWEARARQIASDDEGLLRHWVALRWWWETRRPRADQP